MTEEPLLQSSLDMFLTRLAARTPTPGGGSVAALAGALAAALGRMVAAFTVDKPRFAAVATAVGELAQRLARAEALLRGLIDEDAAAYDVLSGALRMDREDAERATRVAEAALLAAQVPLQSATISHDVLTTVQRLATIGNPMLKADLIAAGALAKAAVAAAVANVRANLPLLDAASAAEIESQLVRLANAADERPAT